MLTVTTFPAIPLTSAEQYILELMNLARANPNATAQKYNISLNEGLPAGTISTTPKQPLAPNTSLLNGARAHLNDMLTHNFFVHTTYNSSKGAAADVLARMTTAGYPSPWMWGENIAWMGTTGTVNVQQFLDSEFQNLFVDKGITGRGHRTNILENGFEEIGSGVATGRFNPGSPSNLYNAVLVTDDFATRSGNNFLTGVIYQDINHNGSYDIGDGLSGVTIRATNAKTADVFQTSTSVSGGYSLPLPAGTYTVVVSGAGALPQQKTVTIGSSNVLADFVEVIPTFSVQVAASAKKGRVVNFTVTAVDNLGKTITGFTGTIHIELRDPQTSATAPATLTIDYPFKASDAGRHTISFTPNRTGTYKYTWRGLLADGTAMSATGGGSILITGS